MTWLLIYLIGMVGTLIAFAFVEWSNGKHWGDPEHPIRNSITWLALGLTWPIVWVAVFVIYIRGERT